MSRNDPTEIEVTFVTNTAAAVLVEFEELEHWLPFSQVTYDGDFEHCRKGELIEIAIPEWLAFERGMI